MDVEQILGKARCSSWQRSKVSGIKCLCIARTRFGEENGNHVRDQITNILGFIGQMVFIVGTYGLPRWCGGKEMAIVFCP